MKSIAIILFVAFVPVVLFAEEGLVQKVNRLEAVIAKLEERLEYEQVPVGTVIVYAGPVEDTGEIQEPIPGYLLSNGAVIERDGQYATLAKYLDTSWGNGGDEDPNTVNLPDLRGVFLRGINGEVEDEYSDPDTLERVARLEGGNSGNQVGSFQLDEFRSHNHGFSYISGRSMKYGDNARDFNFMQQTNRSSTTSVTGGNETRPKNANRPMKSFLIILLTVFGPAILFAETVIVKLEKRLKREQILIVHVEGTGEIREPVSDCLLYRERSSIRTPMMDPELKAISARVN